MKKTIASLFVALAVLSGTSIVEAQSRNRRTSSRLPSAAQREVSRLSSMDELDEFPIPILFGVSPSNISDSWGDARSQGRTHEGTDIIAPGGMYVVAPSDSVVTSIGFGSNGGNYVYTTNPGGERYYFAHLTSEKEGLKVGDILEKGDLIGYVGNTGNASGGAPHLHLGIYGGGAKNPYERLTEEFTTKERLEYAERIIDDADDEEEEAKKLVSLAPAFFRAALLAKEDLHEEIVAALATVVVAPPSAGGGTVGFRDLTLGASGADVVKLQAALIKADEGPAATALSSAGATGYFGPITQRALAEWQDEVNISPAVGYFGSITRAKMTSLKLI